MIYKQYLFASKLPLMNRAMDTYALRQKTITKNIANESTPHYRPESVKFEEFFQESEITTTGSTTDEKHIPLGKVETDAVEGEVEPAAVPKPEVYFSGENHVNIDKEMSELAQNQIKYRFASIRVKGYFQNIQSSIRGISG